MRCHAGTCMNRGEHTVTVLQSPERALRPICGGFWTGLDPDDSDALVEAEAFGLCCGCYLRMLRQRRRAGMMKPWPTKPIPWKEFWGYFEGWEPEPEYPNDEYMAEMERGCWRNR